MPAKNDQQSAEAMGDVKRTRAAAAIKRIHESSIKNGTANMSMEEIDSIIAEYRRERRAKREWKSLFAWEILV